MTVNFETLHKNMRLLRITNDISQEELASTIHLTRSTYSAYESGAKTPDLQTLDALVTLYNISFDSLVNYDLSEGLINRIYFTEDNKDLALLLNTYQSLSVFSKFLISQRVNLLLEKEMAIYRRSLMHTVEIKK